MNYTIILSGGIGTRFWPLSRKSEPKQFLSICSEKSMIEETMHRISILIKKKNIYIAANKMHKQKFKKCFKIFNLPLKNFFFEPQSKNTLAPIAVLSKIIRDLDKDAVVAVLPSDHFIKNNDRFIKLFAKGIQVAKRGYIVTLGIPPNKPETGYGYIKINPKYKINSKIYKVDRFIEKPNIAKAKEFIKDKRYYWNSGIFIFKPDIFLEEIQKFMPKVYNIIMRMKNKKDCINLWSELPSISIDYAIMERTNRAVVLPADCGWTDLGSWLALVELMQKNKNGNVFQGECIDIASKDTFVWSSNRLVATLGLKDIIVVETKDAILVCNKEKTQNVKNLVGLLNKKRKKYV